MKNKLIKITFVSAFFSMVFSSMPLISLANDYSIGTNSSDNESGITTFADITGWRTTIINGAYYKRLYNYSKGQWIGNWIKC